MNTKNWKVYAIAAVAAVMVLSLGFQLLGKKFQKETPQPKVTTVSFTLKTGIERHVGPTGTSVWYNDYRIPEHDFHYFLTMDGVLQGVRFFRIREEGGRLGLMYYSIEDDQAKSVSGNLQAILDPRVHSRSTGGVPVYFWSKSPEGMALQRKCREVMQKYSADHPGEKIPELKPSL